MGQIAYVWHDRELDAFKIGKADDENRFLNRCKEALGANPCIEFVAAWQTMLAKPSDAGEILASVYDRHSFGTGAKEWYWVSTVEAVVQRGIDLFGSPKYASLPTSVLEHHPWDPFGNLPLKGKGASRIWVHKERRIRGYIKVSDNSWWTPNLKPTWNNTFSPRGFELVAAFELAQLADRANEWTNLNNQTRTIKFDAQRSLGLNNLLPISKIGWLGCSEVEVIKFLRNSGLQEFDPRASLRAGICGQGEHYRCKCGGPDNLPTSTGSW